MNFPNTYIKTPSKYGFFILIVMALLASCRHQGSQQASIIASQSSDAMFSFLSEHDLPPLTAGDFVTAQRIVKNETGGQIKNLMHWGATEDLVSFGYFHSIWFCKETKTTRFTETFPDLVRFMKDEGVNIPDYLEKRFFQLQTIVFGKIEQS